MDFSDPNLLSIGLLMAAPIFALGLLNLALRPRGGGFLRGWTGAVFIGICWIAAIAMILARLGN